MIRLPIAILSSFWAASIISSALKSKQTFKIGSALFLLLELGVTFYLIVKFSISSPDSNKNSGADSDETRRIMM